jgi:hypothetical protein
MYENTYRALVQIGEALAAGEPIESKSEQVHAMKILAMLEDLADELETALENLE